MQEKMSQVECPALDLTALKMAGTYFWPTKCLITLSNPGYLVPEPCDNSDGRNIISPDISFTFS